MKLRTLNLREINFQLVKKSLAEAIEGSSNSTVHK